MKIGPELLRATGGATKVYGKILRVRSLWPPWTSGSKFYITYLAKKKSIILPCLLVLV